jgi:2-hydroxychromene-2-carboxylate isomerase
MKNTAIQFMFDFGSPNAYFCHKVIPSIEVRTGVKFEYVPILLGGLFKLSNNRSPMEAFAGIPNKQAYDKLEIQRFRNLISQPYYFYTTLSYQEAANSMNLLRKVVV